MAKPTGKKSRLLHHLQELEKVQKLIEKVNEERRRLSVVKACVFDAARSDGINVPAFKEIARLRGMPAAERTAVQDALDEYKMLLGLGNPK